MGVFASQCSERGVKGCCGRDGPFSNYSRVSMSFLDLQGVTRCCGSESVPKRDELRSRPPIIASLQLRWKASKVKAETQDESEEKGRPGLAGALPRARIQLAAEAATEATESPLAPEVVE